jgi:monothiol glutaredoxin
MKGTRVAPRCGFSARVVQILDALLPDYQTVDVLADPAIREGVKQYSSWPTIPQLYIRGEFVGGCDIITELFENGGLHQKLGVTAPDPPKISATEEAVRALKEAVGEEGEFLRLEVDSEFEHALSIGPRQPGDIEVELNGLTLLVDRMSAMRADGVHIECVQSSEGPAFKITNPKRPPLVTPLTAGELKRRRDSGEAMILVDVRTPEERAMAHIEGAALLDQELSRKLESLDPSTMMVFHCHHGFRSQRVAQEFVQRGFRNIYNLMGGIDAWSLEVDPGVPRY